MQGAAGGFLVYPGVREGNGVGVMKCERYAVGSSAAGWGGVGGGGVLLCSPLPGPAAGGGVFANLPTCQLFDLSGSWQVGGVRRVRWRARAVVGVGAGGRSQARKHGAGAGRFTGGKRKGWRGGGGYRVAGAGWEG